MQKNLGVPSRCQDANLEARCRAQRLEDLQILASQLERTPTKEELAAFVNKYGKHSLEPHSLRTLFDAPLSEVFLEAGITPRIKGQNVYVRTPEQRKAYKREWLRNKRKAFKDSLKRSTIENLEAV